MKLDLAGDTMLGRKVDERLTEVPATKSIDDATGQAELFALDRECAVSERAERLPPSPAALVPGTVRRR
ncbi:MAG TPA: hypothetical protein VND62_07505 [Acidimicrobiales bacterium]|nr:hypothetical protein [Acidimicrobiales bacterium]